MFSPIILRYLFLHVPQYFLFNEEELTNTGPDLEVEGSSEVNTGWIF
jgi:hypothetical protein